MWLILRILHNVTESYRYYYKTITTLEKGFMRTYNDSMSRLQLIQLRVELIR